MTSARRLFIMVGVAGTMLPLVSSGCSGLIGRQETPPPPVVIPAPPLPAPAQTKEEEPTP